MTYGYHLSGQLKSLTDPSGASFDYVNDKVGRLERIDGANFAGVTNYARDFRYRAFGGIKTMTYGTSDSAAVSLSYDNRLRISAYEAATTAVTGNYLQKATYSYYADSSTKQTSNAVDSRFDRTFEYDFAGRLTSNRFGAAELTNGTPTTPFTQTISYNGFSDMTSRQSSSWEQEANFTATYLNGRRESTAQSLVLHDAAGNVVSNSERGIGQRSRFDAAGRMAVLEEDRRYSQL